MSQELIFPLLLLVAVIFGVGFAPGFALRAYISRQHRRRARKQDLAEMASEFRTVSDAPQLSPQPDRLAASSRGKAPSGIGQSASRLTPYR
jgi:hypothetical protein